MIKTESKASLRSTNMPNSNALTEEDVQEATALLKDAVEHVKEYLPGYYQQYQSRMNLLLDQEVDKLAG